MTVLVSLQLPRNQLDFYLLCTTPERGVATNCPSMMTLLCSLPEYRYDTEFVISEVNADIVTYVRTPSGDRLASSNHTKVGKKMSTKAVGGTDRVDITSQYKHPEGSPEERAALGRDDTAAAKSDVGVNIETATDVVIGEELRAELVLTSTASAPRTAGYTIHLSPVTYIGALGAIMATIRDSTVVEPGGVCACARMCACKQACIFTVTTKTMLNTGYYVLPCMYVLCIE